ncbi:B-cell receptor CD22-like isoform X2 [Anguilla anguilla]|uniref:B-cell receptor CD22-like isoform X2 n=1 Tax=Anguilla anguilla TaxID=7936 RepID=UPI0015B0DD38|nr:B-cell receptor CD22-like isoform X2 [Anguilla anguilla]
MVTEGQSVILTCSTTCTLTGSAAFIWYRDGSPLFFASQAHQFTASSEDAGRYSCAVKGYELHSPAVALNVRYPPKSVSVSVSPSGEIVEGSSVTLTCISDANPPVQRYTWYKNNRAVSSETGGPVDSYTIKNITLQDAGEYYCEAGNGIGTNRSPPKRLDVQSALQVTVQGGQSLIAAAAVGVAAILALVFLGVVCVRRRKSTNETEEDRQGNKSPIFGNVSGMAMSHTGTQGTDRDDGEVPLYASVQPANTHNQDELLPSTVQKPLPQCEEGVQYASIQFRPSSAAPRSPAPSVKEDCVLYSTLRKLDM